MPENYREPLILFYREQRSVEHVADELELSEDAVKQRLSRGRKLLQEAMITFVEDTLEKSKPGAAFTMAVLAAISGASSPPVKAAALGVGVAKAGSSFKWTSLITILAPFSGLVSSFFGLRTGLDQSRTPRERRSTIKFVALFMLIAIVYVAGMFAFKHLAVNNEQSATLYAIFSQCLVFGFSASYIILVIRMFKDMRQLRAQERLFNPEAFESEAHQVGSKQREYRSRFCLAGIPLLHFRFGMPEQGDKPVVGWIAGGEHAFGLLFAWGGIAIAPISVGIISVGVISIGAIGLGLIGLGTVAIGVVGFGASAIAYKG